VRYAGQEQPVPIAAKLIGKTTKGKLLLGYSRLPVVDYSPYVIEAKIGVEEDKQK